MEAGGAAEEKGVTNIEFRIEDVHNLKISDSQFDILTSRFAAHRLTDIKKALSEMCRVLKPGGKFYILDYAVVGGDELEREMNRIELLRDSSHQCSYSPRLWKQLFAGMDLDVQHIMLYKEQYRLPQWFDRMGTDTKQETGNL